MLLQISTKMRTSLAVTLTAFASVTSAAHNIKDNVVVYGSGTTNPQRYLQKISDRFEEETLFPLKMSYRAVGSGIGMKEFVGDENSNFEPYGNFHCADIPVGADEYQLLTSKNIKVLQIPYAIGAIAIYHSVPAEVYAAAGEIDLDGCTLAKIFQALSPSGTILPSRRSIPKSPTSCPTLPSRLCTARTAPALRRGRRNTSTWRARLAGRALAWK